MAIPAALFSLLVLNAAVNSDSDEPVDTVEADVAQQASAVEIEATTTTTTTTPPNALAEVAPADSGFYAVSDTEVSKAQGQLGEAVIVAVFEGFSDYGRDSYDGGGWPDTDGDCQSDRHEILIEESLVEPVLDAEGCRVESGLWVDPYDGTEYTNARLATIDHMIPLSAAHQAGAWQWDEQSKRAFASDISFPAAHVVVGQDINQSKGNQGPEDWRPPAHDAWCRYGVDWIAVKDRWSLAFTEAEVEALEDMLNTCDPITEINTLGGGVVAVEVSPTITTPETSTTTSTTSTTSTTTTIAPTTTVAQTSAPAPATDCHPNYDPCLPNRPGDALNCGDISAKNIRVSGADPYRLDGDNDGVGCES